MLLDLQPSSLPVLVQGGHGPSQKNQPPAIGLRTLPQLKKGDAWIS